MCQNLVNAYDLKETPVVLRVSFRPDRSLAQIQAELDFVNYLAESHVRVSCAVPS